MSCVLLFAAYTLHLLAYVNHCYTYILQNTHSSPLIIIYAGPSQFVPVSSASPFANLYYAVELPGVMKAIFLTSYSPQQTFSKEEEQYKWLVQELKQVTKRC